MQQQPQSQQSSRSSSSTSSSLMLVDPTSDHQTTEESIESPSAAPVDLTNLNQKNQDSSTTHNTIMTTPEPQQQRTVICQPINHQQQSSTSTTTSEFPTGIDLSLSSSSVSLATQSISASFPTNAVKTTPSLIETASTAMPSPAHLSSSRHIKKVLKHYQAAATLSLNGPDWFLPVYGGSSNGPIASPPSCGGGDSLVSINNNHQTDNDTTSASATSALELTKSSTTSSTPANASASSIHNVVGSIHNVGAAALTTASSSLDLRTNKQHVHPYHHHQQYAPSSYSLSSKFSSLKNHVIFDPLLAPPPFPIQQPPLLTPPDQGPSRSERSETRLEGELIACFMVGGERRLCVPQIFNIVLRDFSLQQINQVIEELQINCSTCTRDQMEVLKLAGDIPPVAPSCGLITKTDAHRLCSTLLGPGTGGSGSGNISTGSQAPPPMDLLNTHYILIYHECFGRCIGRYAPALYTHPSAQCIQCDECMASFTPYAFVCHSHRPKENRTVHWGFDPNNWRSYLLPIEDLTSYDETPLMALSHNFHLLMTDPKNLSQLMLANNQNKSPPCSTLTSNDSLRHLVQPCCTGGRKTLISASSLSSSDLLYQNKNLENIRLIMKEMKARFAKSSQMATNKLINSSITNKRKDTFDTPIISKLVDPSPESLLSSNSFNKRIKLEPLDLHYSAATTVNSLSTTATDNSNQNSSTQSLMSSLVYPFLQSYLTSGMMPSTQSNLSNGQKQTNSNNCNLQSNSTQSCQTEQTTTNYLSALLTGSTVAVTSSSGSSSGPGPGLSTKSANNSLLASFINGATTKSSNDSAIQNMKLPKELVSLFGNGNGIQNQLQNPLYPFYPTTPNANTSLTVDLVTNAHLNGDRHHAPYSNSHPIDRLLSNGGHNSSNNSRINQKQLDTAIKNDFNNRPSSPTTLASHETLDKALIGNGEDPAFLNHLRTSLNSSQPKNINNHQGTSSQSKLSAPLFSPNAQQVNWSNLSAVMDNNHGQTTTFSGESWTTINSSQGNHQSVELDSVEKNKDGSHGSNKTVVSPSELMEGNLYNTIHMLQKMRHLSFELGMVPNLFEPSTSSSATASLSTRNFTSNEQAQSEVESRIQMLGKVIKDSSYEALKRNLSMIEYLIDDILVHLINNNHQIPSSGSLIMERFKKRMFSNILDLLDEIFVLPKAMRSVDSKNELHQQQKLKEEKIEDEDVGAGTQENLSIPNKKDCKSQQQSDEKEDTKINVIDVTNNNKTPVKQELDGQENSQKDQTLIVDIMNNSGTTSSCSSIQFIEGENPVDMAKKKNDDHHSQDDNQQPKSKTNDTKVIHNENCNEEFESSVRKTMEKSTSEKMIHMVVTPLSSTSSSLSSTPSPPINSNNHELIHHHLMNGYNYHRNNINEQLTNAISSFAAAAASVSASSSVSSSISSNHVPSNNFNHSHHILNHHPSLEGCGPVYPHLVSHHHAITASGSTSNTVITTTPTITQQPMLLTTGSPN